MIVVDRLGNEIRPGTHVVYPVTKGSEMWLTRLCVASIEPGPVLVGYLENGRQTRVKNIRNCVVFHPHWGEEFTVDVFANDVDEATGQSA